MCPSYMVTLEEEHSTRGRAHMLFEVLQGEVMRDGWKDEHVKKALDLCLSCKACKSECPDERGHGHVQSGISGALLRRQAPAAACVCVWDDRPLGATRLDRSGLGKFFQQRARVPPDPCKALLHLAPQRKMPQLAPFHFPELGRKAANTLPRRE